MQCRIRMADATLDGDRDISILKQIGALGSWRPEQQLRWSWRLQCLPQARNGTYAHAHPHALRPCITTRPWIEQWAYEPGCAITLPPARHHWGWECVTDEGQGRFLPCEMGAVSSQLIRNRFAAFTKHVSASRFSRDSGALSVPSAVSLPWPRSRAILWCVRRHMSPRLLVLPTARRNNRMARGLEVDKSRCKHAE
jgi:hypothetical protein